MKQVGAWIHEHRWRSLALLAVALSAYVVLGEVLPRAREAVLLYGTWKDRQERLASVDSWHDRELEVQTRREMLQRRFADLYVRMPEHNQMSAILQVVQSNADSAGVAVRRIEPGQRSTFVNYDEVPFRVVLRGSYREVGTFLSRLERSSYVIKVNALQVRRASPDEEGLEGEASLSVIILKEQEAPDE